jgi:cytoskeleton protein RodZ
MEEDEEIEEQPELPVGVGETLRAAREAKGISLKDLAALTRITQRHLGLIETGDFAALPGRTYAIGFSRSYAKAVGLDQNKIAREVREELSQIELPGTGRLAESFEPGDPARVPSARLAWISALIAVILFIAGSIFVWSSYIAPTGSLPWPGGNTRQPAPASSPAPAASPAAVAAAQVPGGQVTFTALAPDIWVKFYDKNGRQLMQKQMGLGESYTVPADAEGPMLWTGRPDALAITVGGKPVAKLSNEQVVMKDVPVTAAALLSRTVVAPAPLPPSGSPTG